MIRYVFLFLILYGPAWGTETEMGNFAQVTASNHLLFSNSKDPSDKEAQPSGHLMHEATVGAHYGTLHTDIQFANRFFVSNPEGPDNPFVLEKKRLELEWKNWELKLGDSHEQLGKGIALSLYRDPAFGIDNTLEGASIKFQSSGLRTKFFLGRINALHAPVAINPQSNPVEGRNVWLAGASAHVNAGAQIEAGPHYLAALSQPSGTTRYDKSWHTVGATFSKSELWQNFDLYLESNVLFWQHSTIGVAEMQPVGTGSYGSLSWVSAPWKVKLESKNYRQYTFEFQKPPTLEEEIVLSSNTIDVFASRLSIERTLGRASVQASYLQGYDRFLDTSIHHGVLGSKFAGPLGLQNEVRGGYRTLPGHNNLIHAALKTKLKTFKAQSIEFGVRSQHQVENLDLSPATEDRHRLELTYVFSKSLNLQLGYEYIPTNGEAAGRHFANLGGSYQIAKLSTRAFVGQTGGGTECSAGVCRRVQPYSGFMLETYYTF
ncbi:MAG: hypothetical protein HY537_12675 [Deltaproteobacteria bacterium]|nr:hypothetical protein [Deltaproteobacteria bacterium]